jgi:cobalamin biosynthesis protein CbiG
MPASVLQVKLEQDLETARRNEEAEYAIRFKHNEVRLHFVQHVCFVLLCATG